MLSMTTGSQALEVYDLQQHHGLLSAKDTFQLMLSREEKYQYSFQLQTGAKRLYFQTNLIKSFLPLALRAAVTNTVRLPSNTIQEGSVSQ